MRLIQKELQKRIKELADKYDLEVADVMAVESAIWKTVANKMAEGNRHDYNTFHNIFLKGLGTFYASIGMYYKVNGIKKE